MTPALRDALAAGLGIAADEAGGLELVARVSASGRSHTEPGLRLFAYRGATAVASVKRLARPDDAGRDRLLGCYQRLAACSTFRVPELLAWRADGMHLYLVESLVPGQPLADLVASGAIDTRDAADRLNAVLLGLWERGTAPSDDEIAGHADALHRIAAVAFADQRAADLVRAALHTLRERHRDTLRRVLTTRDVHIANVHADDDGQTWLTDFDLADEVVFFGLDVVRTWVHSAPLVAPGLPPFLDVDAYRLYETIYPVYEYALQAPLLPDPEREALRTYVQDLFIRLALPVYHRQAAARAEPLIAEPPQARIYFAEDAAGFSEADSVSLPFDLDSGRAHLTTTIRSEQPLRRLRLDPINRPRSVVTVRRWTLTPGGDAAAMLNGAADAAEGHGAELSDLVPLPGTPRSFFASDHPRIVVALDPADGHAPGNHAYVLELELELQREWTLAPELAPALLLGRLQARIAAVDAARNFELAHARDLLADVRRQARMGRRLTMQLSLEPAGAPLPLGTAATVRAQLARVPALARGGARLILAEAARRWRGAPPPPPTASGLVPVAAQGRVWAPPHVAVLVDGDADPPPVAPALAWAQQQTCSSTEVIVWERSTGLAWEARLPHEKWHAPDWSTLRATFAARYVVFGSPQLWAEPPTWLETALFALEGEDLCFAIAVGSAVAPAATALAGGRSPGAADETLPRTVARPEVVTDDGALDFDACRAERGAVGGALGKLLGDSGVTSDAPAFARTAQGAPVGVHGNYVVADAHHRGAMAHPIAAVDHVLDLPPLPSELPTVIMAFPFLAVGGAERVHLDVVRGLRHRIRFVIATIEPHDDRLGTTAAAFRALTPFVYTAPDALHPLLTTSFFEHLFHRFAPQTLYIANGAGWLYDALPTLKAMYPRLRTVNQVYDVAAGWIERLDAPVLAALDAHISCNRRISAALVTRGADATAAVTVHNAVDLALFDPAAHDAGRRAALTAQFGLPAGRKVIAFIGRMHQQKRPMDVVELARQLRADTRLAFLLVGDGPLAATVRAQVAASGLDNVAISAFHQPSSECYAVADVLILPSEYEGMPMVIIEAMAMGVPVVATDVGNNREVLERTGGGRIVDRVGDVAALRQAVLATIEAPPDPAALRAAVAREFGMTDMLEDYARVLLGSGGEDA